MLEFGGAFCFLGAFLGSLLLARYWRRVYIEKGEETEVYLNLTRLVLSGIILGIIPLSNHIGNIFSLLSITTAPLVYLITFSTISTLGTSIIVFIAAMSLPREFYSAGGYFVFAFIYIGFSVYPLILIFDIAASIQMVGIGNPLLLVSS